MRSYSYFIAGEFFCRVKFSLNREGPFKLLVEGYDFTKCWWVFDVNISSSNKMSISKSPRCSVISEEKAVAIVLRGHL